MHDDGCRKLFISCNTSTFIFTPHLQLSAEEELVGETSRKYLVQFIRLPGHTSVNARTYKWCTLNNTRHPKRSNNSKNKTQGRKTERKGEKKTKERERACDKQWRRDKKALVVNVVFPLSLGKAEEWRIQRGMRPASIRGWPLFSASFRRPDLKRSWRQKETRSSFLLLGQFVGEPVEALVETVALGGARGLDVPASAAQLVQAQLVRQLGGAHGVGQVLLVGEHQQHRVAQLVLRQLRNRVVQRKIVNTSRH